MSPPEIMSYESIADEVALNGYSVVTDFISACTVIDMRNEALALQASGAMHRAGIGQGTAFFLNDELRGDEIHWLNETAPDVHSNIYLANLELLRQELNRSLSLGLFEFEGHFAIYPPGAYYRKHLDQFQRDNRRSLTCILYLNDAWQEADGGQLRLYLNGEESAEYLDIQPVGGTLVTFLSSKFWHEVLPANRERVSLTGWYKTRATVPLI